MKNQRSILITGTSSGIGLATALTLKNRGYYVFAGVRNEQDFKKLKNLTLDPVMLDITHDASIKAALHFILEKTGGRLDALFNNAGYMQTGAIIDLDRALIEKQFATNVFGTMALTIAVLPIMQKQGFGRILQNSSILGVVTIPMYGAYNAAKFALEGFSRTLRQELNGSKIFVSIINPGPIESHIRKQALMHLQNVQKQSAHYKKHYKHLENYFITDPKILLKPTAVVKKVMHALESKNPKIHYFIGKHAFLLSLLQRFLPEKSFEWLIHQVTKPAG